MDPSYSPIGSHDLIGEDTSVFLYSCYSQKRKNVFAFFLSWFAWNLFPPLHISFRIFNIHNVVYTQCIPFASLVFVAPKLQFFFGSVFVFLIMIIQLWFLGIRRTPLSCAQFVLFPLTVPPPPSPSPPRPSLILLTTLQQVSAMLSQVFFCSFYIPTTHIMCNNFHHSLWWK